jgi:hypothetical protein
MHRRRPIPPSLRRRSLAATAILVAAATIVAPPPVHAKRWVPRPEYDLIIGRFPRHVPEWTAPVEPMPASVEVLARALDAGEDPPITDRARRRLELEWLIRHDGRDRPGAYRGLARWLDQPGAAPDDLDLAWWAYRRAIELADPQQATLAARAAELEAAWRTKKRPDPPTLEQFRYARAGAERWVASFQKAERVALADKENPADPAVLDRLVGEANMEVPPVIFGADSFMRRYGLVLLIAGIGLAFGTLYLVAAIRRGKSA